MYPVVGMAINPTTMDTKNDKENLHRRFNVKKEDDGWEHRPTYEEYPLTEVRKILFGVTAFLIYSVGIGGMIFLYSVLTSWGWFVHLYVLNIFISILLLPLSFIVAHRCVSFIRRWFVWIEIGRRRAEKRGFF